MSIETDCDVLFLSWVDCFFTSGVDFLSDTLLVVESPPYNIAMFSPGFQILS